VDNDIPEDLYPALASLAPFSSSLRSTAHRISFRLASLILHLTYFPLASLTTPLLVASLIAALHPTGLLTLSFICPSSLQLMLSL